MGVDGEVGFRVPAGRVRRELAARKGGGEGGDFPLLGGELVGVVGGDSVGDGGGGGGGRLGRGGAGGAAAEAPRGDGERAAEHPRQCAACRA
jgi:hypothetical protein